MNFPRRLLVVGSTGAGKSTMAGALARRLGVPHVELDVLNWEPNWTAAPTEIFLARVEAAAPPDGGWVCDGNYSVARKLLWSRAGGVVWLDYPFVVVAWRLWWRTLRRLWTRQVVCNGNREQWWVQFCTRDSLFVWLVSTHWRRRRQFRQWLAARPDLTVWRFTRPAQAEQWLQAVI